MYITVLTIMYMMEYTTEGTTAHTLSAVLHSDTHSQAIQVLLLWFM